MGAFEGFPILVTIAAACVSVAISWGAVWNRLLTVIAVEALLVAARTAKVSRTIQEPEAMSAYGLDPPRVSLTIRGVEAPRLDVGDVAPTGEGFFARIDWREGVLVVDRVEGGALERADPLRHGFEPREYLLIVGTGLEASLVFFPLAQVVRKEVGQLERDGKLRFDRKAFLQDPLGAQP